MIQVDTWPTLPSALGLCFLSEISDNRFYRRKIVIGNVAYIP